MPRFDISLCTTLVVYHLNCPLGPDCVCFLFSVIFFNFLCFLFLLTVWLMRLDYTCAPVKANADSAAASESKTVCVM